MKIFVAGAIGAVVHSLVRSLCTLGHQVVGMTRAGPGVDRLREIVASASTADAFDRHSVRDAIAAAAPDVAIDSRGQPSLSVKQKSPRLTIGDRPISIGETARQKFDQHLNSRRPECTTRRPPPVGESGACVCSLSPGRSKEGQNIVRIKRHHYDIHRTID